MDIKVIASHPIIGCYNPEGICSRLYSLRALFSGDEDRHFSRHLGTVPEKV